MYLCDLYLAHPGTCSGHFSFSLLVYARMWLFLLAKELHKTCNAGTRVRQQLSVRSPGWGPTPSPLDRLLISIVTCVTVSIMEVGSLWLVDNIWLKYGSANQVQTSVMWALIPQKCFSQSVPGSSLGLHLYQRCPLWQLNACYALSACVLCCFEQKSTAK